MSKIAIVTDTASDLSKSDIQKYNINMLHYQILYKDKTFKDQLEISSKEVLDRLEEEVPSTSLPALEEIHALFKELQNAGYTDVIVVTLSSGLSGCYNAVCMVAQDYTDIKVHVYDSRTISAAEGVLAVRAAQLASEGYAVSEIISVLDEMRSNQHTLFIVDTLKYLLHGGRIGHVSAAVGTLLNLKPLITIGDDGKYETVAKVRGRAKAIHSFVELVKENIQGSESYEIYFTHADGKEIADKIIEGLKEVGIDQKVQGESWISPVACVHCGPGYVGMLVQKL